MFSLWSPFSLLQDLTLRVVTHVQRNHVDYFWFTRQPFIGMWCYRGLITSVLISPLCKPTCKPGWMITRRIGLMIISFLFYLNLPAVRRTMRWVNLYQLEYLISSHLCKHLSAWLPQRNIVKTSVSDRTCTLRLSQSLQPSVLPEDHVSLLIYFHPTPTKTVKHIKL